MSHLSPAALDDVIPLGVATAAVTGTMATLLAAEQTAGRLSSGHWPQLRTPAEGIAAALAGLLHPASPRLAWPAPAQASAPTPLLYWTVAAALLTLGPCGAVAAAAGLRRLLSSAAGAGFAPRGTVRSALSAPAVRRLGRAVLPGRHATAEEAGLYLGRHRGGAVWASREDSIVVIGPPRSGKTRMLALPLLWRASGPQVVVSSKHDLLEHLAHAPGYEGRSVVVDLRSPMGFDGRPRPDLGLARSGFDLCAPCATLSIARLTAETFVALTQGGSRSGAAALAGEWRARATQLLTAALHAAGLSGLDAHFVHRCIATESLRHLADLLSDHGGPARGWAEIVRSIDRLPAETRGGVVFGAAAALTALDDHDVRDLLSPAGPLPMLDPTSLIDGGSRRLFVLSGATESGLAAVTTILVERIVQAAMSRAAHLPHERLVPPLLLCIDEMAEACPLRSAPELTQSGGGRGITPLFLFQAPSQLRTAWDGDRASTILSNATATVLLGGLSDVRDLDSIARLTPEVARPTRSRHRDRSGRSSTTDAERWTTAQTAAELRELRSGDALLLYRALRPVQLRLTAWRSGGRDADSRLLSTAALRFGRRHAAAPRPAPPASGRPRPSVAPTPLTSAGGGALQSMPVPSHHRTEV